MTRDIKRTALLFAWIIALVATLITLYASEIRQLPVCHLCWYQRICIYPLAIILGIASFRDDLTITRYGMPLTVLGGLFALYQYLMQMIPDFAPIRFCLAGVSCSDIHLRLFGFVTYPFLSLFACLSILILLLIARPKT